MWKKIIEGCVTHWAVVASATLGAAVFGTAIANYLYTEKTEWVAVSGSETIENTSRTLDSGELTMRIVKKLFGTRCEISGLEGGQVNFVFHNYSERTKELTGELFCNEHTGILGKGVYRRLEDNRVEINVSNGMLNDNDRQRNLCFTFVTEEYFLKHNCYAAKVFERIMTWRSSTVQLASKVDNSSINEIFNLTRHRGGTEDILKCNCSSGEYHVVFRVPALTKFQAAVGVVYDKSNTQIGWASLTKQCGGSVEVAAYSNLGNRDCLFVALMHPASSQ